MTSKILEALDDASRWMDIDGVEGVGQGEKDARECIIVYVSRPSSEFASQIPKEFKGFPVIIQESGQFDIQ
jgi:hypothetical protein